MSEVTLNVRTVHMRELEIAAEDLDVSFETQLGNFDPFTGAVIIAAALAGGKLVIRLWREFKGGTVIDLTKTPVDISRDRDLDYGYFVIIAKDGSVIVEAKDEPKDALERMVGGALELASKATLETLKAVTAKSLGATTKTEFKPA